MKLKKARICKEKLEEDLQIEKDKLHQALHENLKIKEINASLEEALVRLPPAVWVNRDWLASTDNSNFLSCFFIIQYHCYGSTVHRDTDFLSHKTSLIFTFWYLGSVG